MPAHKAEVTRPLIAPYAEEVRVPVLSALDGADLIISAGNHHRIGADVLARSRVINFHAAPLPSYPGSAAPAHAIMNGEERFGVTFHEMVEQLDAGPLIHVESFPIDPEWTSGEVDAQCVKVGVDAFGRLAVPLLNAEMTGSPNVPGRPPYKRSDAEAYRAVDLQWPSDRIWTHVRACDWDGVLKPAYAVLGDRRIHLTAAMRGTWL